MTLYIILEYLTIPHMGLLNRYKYSEPGVVSPLYLCFSVTDIVSTKFLERFFESDRWYRHIYLHGDRGARHDRVSIKDSDFLLIPVGLPSLPEQQKIAEFFSALDERIELTENKLTLLKEQKKGYLQGIFG